MKNSFFHFFLISILLHILIMGGLFWFSHKQQQSYLWSGGSGMTLETIVINLSDEKSENTSQKSQTSKTKKTVFEDDSKKEKKRLIKKRQSSKQKQNSGQTHGAAPTNKTIPKNNKFGKGDSKTPNGGIGSGLDQKGVISKNAPHLLAKIRKKIMRHHYYPKQAREDKITGQVKVSFQIQENGELAYVKVLQSSGSSLLDQAAVKTIRKSVPLPYFSSPIALPLEYKLK